MSSNDEVEATKKYVTNTILQEHLNWHRNHMFGMSDNYGKQFLDFHRQFIGRFDVWRQNNGYSELTEWDPSTPIPIPYPDRNTDNPFSVDPRVARPSWLTPEGGFTRSPSLNYKFLGQFKDANELGNEIDNPGYANGNSWHGLVHVTIGNRRGMANPAFAPKDPIFWKWHKFLDNIYATWESML